MPRRPWLTSLTTMALIIPGAFTLTASPANALTIPASDYQQVSLASGGAEWVRRCRWP